MPNHRRALIRLTIRASLNACAVTARAATACALLALVGLVALVTALPASASASGSAGASCTATSGAAVPAVIELYTSEGCDSCPPADRWLASLGDLAARGIVIPLAFHIDYWDYLGWKDPYADPVYAARHRQRASESGARVIYTPQVLYDNREFQAWRRTPAQKLPVQAGRSARADLRIAASRRGGGGIALDVSGTAQQGVRNATAWVALYESGLSSDVKAGENRGVTLHHDFVVRQWLGPFAFDNNRIALSQAVMPPNGSKTERSGIAVIARDDRGNVIQALSLPLRGCAG